MRSHLLFCARHLEHLLIHPSFPAKRKTENKSILLQANEETSELNTKDGMESHVQVPDRLVEHLLHGALPNLASFSLRPALLLHGGRPARARSVGEIQAVCHFDIRFPNEASQSIKVSIRTREKESSEQTIPTTEQSGGNRARKAGTPPTAKNRKGRSMW
jgi:hypothetical protein